MAAQFGWKILTMDVVGAYLPAEPARHIYLQYPRGFADYLRRLHNGALPFDPDLYVLRAAKNVYGLKDAGRVWYRELTSILDPCLFVRARVINGVRRLCLLVVYVDDLLVVGDADQVDITNAELSAKLPLQDGGDDFLGLRIRHTDRGVSVDQAEYAPPGRGQRRLWRRYPDDDAASRRVPCRRHLRLQDRGPHRGRPRLPQGHRRARLLDQDAALAALPVRPLLIEEG